MTVFMTVMMTGMMSASFACCVPATAAFTFSFSLSSGIFAKSGGRLVVAALHQRLSAGVHADRDLGWQFGQHRGIEAQLRVLREQAPVG